jgi:hypothetical protein
MRFHAWARLVLLGFGVLEVLKGLAGIWFHVKIIELATSGHAIPDFGYRVEAIAEWPDWALGTLLGAYIVWVMLQPTVKAAFKRGRAVG